MAPRRNKDRGGLGRGEPKLLLSCYCYHIIIMKSDGGNTRQVIMTSQNNGNNSIIDHFRLRKLQSVASSCDRDNIQAYKII